MDQPLDVFGQQPGLNRLYTQLCLCFALDDSRRNDAVQTLEAGLGRLTESIPWLTGRVLHEEDTKRYMIRARHDRNQDGLYVRNRSDTLPSMDELRSAGFPAYTLDEERLACRRSIRVRPDSPATVFLVQANFVKGGLLLTICALHSCMDMAGQGYITSLFAQACRGDEFTTEQVQAANLRGDGVIPMASSEEVAGHTSRPIEGAAAKQTPARSSETVDAIWSYVIFSGSELAELKAAAMEDLTTEFVSTDDCLSASLWQSITRARLARFSDTNTETIFTRTVDARKAAGISPTYTGNAAVKSACSMSMDEIVTSSLGAIASKLREGLKEIGSQLRTEATLLKEGKPTSKPSVEPSTGVNLSSWAKENAYDLDFGPLLRKPEAVRRPTFPAWESLVYLMPKKADGEIAAAVCLREEDMKRLKGGLKSGRFVG